MSMVWREPVHPVRLVAWPSAVALSGVQAELWSDGRDAPFLSTRRFLRSFGRFGWCRAAGACTRRKSRPGITTRRLPRGFGGSARMPRPSPRSSPKTWSSRRWRSSSSGPSSAKRGPSTAGPTGPAAQEQGERWGCLSQNRASRLVVAWASGPREAPLAEAVVRQTRQRTKGRAGGLT